MSGPPFEPRRFGAYTLEARLGHGGMAEVFRANREGVAGFARTCVVKRILGHHNEDPAFVEMFINEAKIAAKLTHPNIVQVYELGQVDGEFFIAMEYVKGNDLLRILRELAQKRASDPAIPATLAAYVARDTCRALQHAHDHADERGQARPIIHRDVSPQNIMISNDGLVKLVDFGIAKALGTVREETRTGALKGKFAYMAPEQVQGQSPGASADVFSTGVVLHEMLTGRRLFKGATDYDTLQKVRSMTVPAPSSIEPRIPQELDAIVMRSLERDRGKRYERAAQMARDLDGFLQTARFSVEDMVEFVRGVFPVESVTPLGENATTEYRNPSRPGGLSPVETISQEATPLSSSLAQLGYEQPDATPTGSGGRRTMVVAGALALLVFVSIVFVYRRGGTPPELTVTAVQLADPAAAPGGASPPEVIQLPPETRGVRVRSEPEHARVFDGPRLVGEAPVDIKLPVDSSGMQLTLVHEGRADLSFLLRPADAPEITLRLLPESAASRAVRPHASGGHTPPRPAHPLQKPKVEIFDDSTPAPRSKVDAVDP